MKKLLVFLLCALLLMAGCAHAQGNYVASCGGTQVLTVSYDDSSLRLDTDSYLGSTRGRHYWLGTFYNSSYTIELAADRYDDLPGGSDLQQLADYLCSRMADESAALVETYRGGMPFVILSLNGAVGNSYYAATLSQGYVVHFEIYNLRGGVDASALTTLKALLNGAGN